LHRHRSRLHQTLTKALAERVRTGWPSSMRVRIVTGPDTYLAGESSALAAFLDGQGAIPRAASAPLAARGVAGRPTVVSNAETLAHFALIVRFGSHWYQQAGTSDSPGSTLVTLAGEVSRPGLVVEVLEPVSIGALLSAVGGWVKPPRAVLLGGYAGVWVDGAEAWDTLLDRYKLAAAGAGLGCGLIAVLGPDRCGLAETARLTAWLSAESAGQCGPCAHGMPALTDALREAIGTRVRTADLHRIHELSTSITERGLCHLPDGAAALVYSALATFRDEVRAHRRLRRRCPKRHDDAASPVPLPPRLAP
jgi:NADH:ubiquinone oxidoreductase subunit F (NADH-binding)